MIIRKANTDDAQQISELALRSKGYWGYDTQFLELCRAELTYSQKDLTDQWFYVLESPNLKGFYALSAFNNKTIDLEALFVEPKCIGQGYGYNLLMHAKNTAKKIGANKIDIVADPFASEFYQKQGAKYLGTVESGSIKGRQLPRFQIQLNPNA